MFTDKELADKVVALGVGSLLPTKNKYGIHVRSYPWYEINDDEFVSGSTTKSAKHFVRDWRVAGALMEKCFELNTTRTHAFNPYWPVQSAMSGHQFGGESLPRAIIEACVEALCDS